MQKRQRHPSLCMAAGTGRKSRLTRYSYKWDFHFPVTRQTRHVVIDCDFKCFSCPYSNQPHYLQCKLSIAKGFAPRAANTTSFTRASCAGACLCLSSQHSGTGTGNTDGIFLLQDIWPSPPSWGWSSGPPQATFGELICGNGFLKSFPLKMGTSSKMSGYATNQELRIISC